MKLNKLTQVTILGAALCGASAYADDALLDILVKKGVLSSAEADAVAAEIQAEQPLSVKAKGKETVEVRFNGRVQAQYDGLSMEENGSDLPSTNHFYFRRLYFGAKAKLSNGIYAETVLDFAGDTAPELNFDKAIVGYKFDDAFTGILGFQKVPFGYEETSSSSGLPTIERSAANRFFADDIDFSSRHMGLHAEGEFEGGFSYGAALVNSEQGEGSRLGGASNTSNDLSAYVRVQWSNDMLTLGADYGAQKGNSVVGDDVSAFTAYANAKIEDLNLLAEVFQGDLGVAEDVMGYSLRASYKIDKFEPVIRYSYVKADVFDIDTDELIRRAPSGGTVSGTDNEINSFYLGANYYLSKATTLMLGYEIADAENDAGTDEAEVSGLRARIQVLW